MTDRPCFLCLKARWETGILLTRNGRFSRPVRPKMRKKGRLYKNRGAKCERSLAYEKPV